ncbi:MAG: SIS domain-containing protein [Bacteroidales bacterium]|nr:SIS domain-containing protein [Bacteroidales bacterium]
MTHDYNTYREIRQQPAVWRKALEYVRAHKHEIKAFTNKYLRAGYEVVLTGAGTSAYIGDALEPALFSTSFKSARAIATTDIITNPQMFFDDASKVLLVSFARSGNSPESVGAIRSVERNAGKVAHIFITCNKDGELAQTKGDNILTLLLPPETNDLSLAMTSSYSTMFLTCALIAHIDNIEEQRAAIDLLSEKTALLMKKYEGSIKEIAAKDFKRAVFLGSGTLKGVAEESRLKLQELTDGAVMCAFDSFLGFRHGPKAVVNSDCLVVYLLSPYAEIQRYELDLVRQIKAGSKVNGSILICNKAPGIDPSNWDLCIETGIPADMPGCYGGVAYVVVAQLLGFYKSLDCGLIPDTPSVSGNISRVVEGVTLYI